MNEVVQAPEADSAHHLTDRTVGKPHRDFKSRRQDETVPSVPSLKQQQQARTRVLLTQYRDTGDVGIRDELIGLNLGIVRYVAARFASRGESFEDLFQVGCMGLLKAIERFEPERGLEFLTYAVPTISGEIQRYFRDSSSTVRVPRLIQSLCVACDSAIQTLTRERGRAPTIAEIAAFMGVSEERVIEADEARRSRVVSSIDELMDNTDNAHRSLSWLGRLDPNLAAVETHLDAANLLACLPVDERRLVDRYFEQRMSQRSIAKEVGVSQMQVSRVLARALARMRERARSGACSGNCR